mgnify:CR=1 FL=1
MKITIDTKEDSVHEIKHIINLLQQILGRQGSSRPTDYEHSSYSNPYSSPEPRQAQPSNPFSVFDSAPAQPTQSAAPAPFSMFDAPSTPTTGTTPSYSDSIARSIPAQPAEETPSIFDIFGNDKTTPSQTTQETAEDLLHYDEERGRKDSSYTFTTY